MAEMLILNPKRRKKRKTVAKKTVKRKTMARRAGPKRALKRVVRRQRNPIAKKGFGGILQNTVLPSAIAAGGAIGLDIMMSYVPVPDTIKEGPMKHLVKGVGAIGMGMLASMFLKAKTAELITTGAMTVVMHSAGKEMLQKMAPNIQMDGMDYDDDYDDLSYVSAGMPVGEYLGGYVSNGDMDGISLDEELEL
jgi:hypothetical protein